MYSRRGRSTVTACENKTCSAPAAEICTSTSVTPLSAIRVSRLTVLPPGRKSSVVGLISWPPDVAQTRTASDRVLTRRIDNAKCSPESTFWGDSMLSAVTGRGAMLPAGTAKIETPRSRARTASESALPRVSFPSLISKIRRAPCEGNVAQGQMQRAFHITFFWPPPWHRVLGRSPQGSSPSPPSRPRAATASSRQT